MRCLVTGGCGFIGSHLVEALVARRHAVRVLDNLSSGREANLAAVRGAAEFVRGDIRDGEALAAALRGVEVVFHEAALVSVAASIADPMENHAVNLTGTLNVLQASSAAGVRRVILASSAAVYGNAPELPKREDLLPRPESPYAAAKLAGEHYAAVFSDLYGLETICLRYFNVYGPRQDPSSVYSGVISRFVDAALRGEPPTVFGDGRQTRDFVFVNDVVAANLLAAQAPTHAHGDTFNVATGRGVSLLDLLSAIERAAGVRLAPRFEPARQGEVRHSAADIAAARERLGFAPAHTLDAGLADLVAWARAAPPPVRA